MKRKLTLFAVVVLALVLLSGCNALLGKPSQKTINKYLEKAVPEVVTTQYELPQGYTVKEEYLTDMFHDEYSKEVDESLASMLEEEPDLLSKTGLSLDELRDKALAQSLGRMLNYYDAQGRLLLSAGPLDCLLPDVVLLAFDLPEYAFSVNEYDVQTGEMKSSAQYNIDLKDNGAWWQRSIKEMTEKGFVEKEYDRLSAVVATAEVELNEKGLPVHAVCEGCEYDSEIGVIENLYMTKHEDTFTYDDEGRVIREERLELGDFPTYSFRFIEMGEGEQEISIVAGGEEKGSRILREYRYAKEGYMEEQTASVYAPDGTLTAQLHAFFDADGNILKWDELSCEEDRWGHPVSIREFFVAGDILVKRVTTQDAEDGVQTQEEVFNEKTGALLTGITTSVLENGVLTQEVVFSEKTGEPLTNVFTFAGDRIEARGEYAYRTTSENEGDDLRPNCYPHNILGLFLPYNGSGSLVSYDGWWKKLGEYYHETDARGKTVLHYEKYEADHPSHEKYNKVESYENGVCVFSCEDTLTGGFCKTYEADIGCRTEQIWEVRPCPEVTTDKAYKNYVYLRATETESSSDGSCRVLNYTGTDYWKSAEEREFLFGLPINAIGSVVSTDEKGRTVYKSEFLQRVERSPEKAYTTRETLFEYSVESFDAKGNPYFYRLLDTRDGVYHRESVEESEDNTTMTFVYRNDAENFLSFEKTLVENQDPCEEFGENLVEATQTRKDKKGNVVSVYVLYYRPVEDSPTYIEQKFYEFFTSYEKGRRTSSFEENHVTGMKVFCEYRKDTGELFHKQTDKDDNLVSMERWLDDFYEISDISGGTTSQYVKGKLVYLEKGDVEEDYRYDASFKTMTYRCQRKGSARLYWYYNEKGKLIGYDDGKVLHRYNPSTGAETETFAYDHHSYGRRTSLGSGFLVNVEDTYVKESSEGNDSIVFKTIVVDRWEYLDELQRLWDESF